MTFHPWSVNYWNIFFERFTQKAIWWNSCKNQQQPCRGPSPDTFRLNEDSERDLTVQVSLSDSYNTYIKIHSETIISVNFFPIIYQSFLFYILLVNARSFAQFAHSHISYSYCTAVITSLWWHVLNLLLYALFSTEYFTGQVEKSLQTNLLMWLYYFYPFWFDKHVVPCIILCSISKLLMKKI